MSTDTLRLPERFAFVSPGPRHAMTVQPRDREHVERRGSGMLDNGAGAEAPQPAPGRESDAIGADAASGVARSLNASEQVKTLLDSARVVFDEIERDGLALIERQQQELAAFQARVQAFVSNGSTLAHQLRAVVEQMQDGAQRS